MGCIYSVSCEAIWCLKKVILPKFHLVVGLSQQVLAIVSYASRTSNLSIQDTESYLRWVRNGLYTESNTVFTFSIGDK